MDYIENKPENEAVESKALQNAVAEDGETASKDNELLVYSQFIRTRDNGAVIYKGEDAYPYIDDQLFFVADGLGGSGASPHTRFDKRLFEEDKVVPAFFEGIFSNITDETFCNYVKKSFMELRAVKDCYHDHHFNLKHSAYFGSRLVGAILLQMLKENEGIQPSALFETYKKAENKEIVIQELEKASADYIREKLMAVAQKVGLEHESEQAKKNFRLLATSLCAAIYQEQEDGVDLMYLNAGDSRAYMWDKDGLHQVVKDQESASGAMTNSICADERIHFVIKCKYMHVNKPCVLFNATDGCFDAFPLQISPLALEYYMLDVLTSSKSLADAGETMGKFFMADGNRNDDSSTMALKMFGFASFEELQAAAAERLQTIQKEYTTDFPDIFKADYALLYKKANLNLQRSFKNIKTLLFGDAQLIEYCKRKVKREGSDEFNSSMEATDAETEKSDKAVREAERELKSIFMRSYDVWVETLALDENAIHEKDRSEISEKRSELEQGLSAYRATIGEYLEKQQTATAALTEILNSLLDYRTVQLIQQTKAFSREDTETVKKARKNTLSVVNFLSDPPAIRSRTFKKFDNAQKAYYKLNRKAAQDSPAFDLQMLITRAEQIADVHAIGLLPEDADALLKWLAIRQNHISIKSELKAKEAELLRKEAERYLNADYLLIIERIAGKDIQGVSEETKEICVAYWNKYKESAKEMKEKNDKQKALFHQYNIEHFKYIADEGEAQ